MTRLRKRDAARLLDRYDSDPISALSVALGVVLDVNEPLPSWSDLVASCGFDDERTRRLVRGDPDALDQLAAELNELRQLHG